MSEHRADREAQERRLMRLVHGELPADEARRLERRLDDDPELRSAWQRLRRTWEALEPPPPSPPPAGFARQVLERVRRERDAEMSWRLAPTWARAAATTALTAGVVLGLVLGGRLDDGFEPTPAAVEAHLEASLALDPDLEPGAGDAADAEADVLPVGDGLPTLADAYWLALEESGGRFDGTLDDGTVDGESDDVETSP